MQNPEKPSGDKEAAAEAEKFNIDKEAEGLRKALGVKEEESSPEDWLRLIKTLMQPLKKPEESQQPAVVKEELKVLYNQVFMSGAPSSLHTVAITALAEARTAGAKGETLSVEDQKRIKLALAQYFEIRYQYEEKWAARPGTGSSVPEFLAKFVRLRDGEKFAFRVAKNLLPIQYDVMEAAGYDPLNKEEDKPWFRNADAAGQIILLAIDAQLSFQYVLDCAKEDGSPKGAREPYEKFLIKCGVPKDEIGYDTIRHAKMIMGFLNKYPKKTKAMAKFLGIKQSELTFNQALEAVAETAIVGKLAKGMVEVLEGFNPIEGLKMPDLGTFAKEVFEDSQNYPDRARQMALLPLIELVQKDARNAPTTEKIQKDAEAAALFLLGTKSGNTSLATISRISDSIFPDQYKIVESMAKEISSKQSQDKVMSAMFIDPTEKLGGREQLVQEALADLMGKEKLKTKDAFELYYLLHGENTLGVAYKALQILKDGEYTNLAFRMRIQVFKSYAELASESVEDIDKLAEKLKLTKEQATELRNLRLYLKDHGVDLIDKTSGYYWALWEDFPGWMSILHGAALSGTAYAAYVRVRWDKIARLADCTSEVELEKWVREYGRVKPGDANYDQLMKQAKAMQPKAKEIISKHRNLGYRSSILRLVVGQMPRPTQIVRGIGLRMAGTAVVKAATSENLEKMAKTLRNNTHYEGKISEVVKIMAPCGSVGEVAEALHDAGYEVDEIKTAIGDHSQVLELAGRTVGNVEVTLGRGWADVRATEAELKVLDGRKRGVGRRGGGRR